MKLGEFLRSKTQSLELCVVREDGLVVATYLIHDESLFCRYLSSKLCDMEVKGDKWDYLPTVNENGTRTQVRCHYIDV